jgi:hypothetical protein
VVAFFGCSFLNRAALKTGGDFPIAIQSSLTILQALTMDRHLGSSHFKIPADSMLVLV